jgi:hypothetical protein
MSHKPEFDLWPHCRGITAQVLLKGACGWHEDIYRAAFLSMMLPALLLVTDTVLQMLDHSCLTATCCEDTMLALGEDMMGGKE